MKSLTELRPSQIRRRWCLARFTAVGHARDLAVTHAAAGDRGPRSGRHHPRRGDPGTSTARLTPASDPLVLAAGGTSLNASHKTGAYLSETAWGQPYGDPGSTFQAAPLWAGLIALADQYAGHRLGFVNPALYHIAHTPLYHQAFHDITTGTNTVTFPPKTITGYRAAPGRDPVTGLAAPTPRCLSPCSPATPPPEPTGAVPAPIGDRQDGISPRQATPEAPGQSTFTDGPASRQIDPYDRAALDAASSP